MVRSIRVRLLLWYALVLTAVVAGYAGLVYYEARAARLAAMDGQLESASSALDASLRLFPPHELTGEPPPFKGPEQGFAKGFPPPKKEPNPPNRERLLNSLDLPGPPSERPRDTYFAVWRRDQTLLKRGGLPPNMNVPTPTPGRATLAFRGSNRELTVLGPEQSVILVGRPAQEVKDELTAFAWQLALTGAAVLSVGLVGGWLVSRRIVRPIRTIATAASRISANNLSERIDPERVETELEELALVLNATFQRLQAAFDRQSRFTADASHELRTPLAVIRSQAELALTRPREANEYREALQGCLRAAERMTDLVDGLLALARADAGTLKSDREAVELHKIVEESVDLCRTLAEPKQVALSTRLEPVKVMGNASALSRVVTNLVSNAIQYNRPKGQVRVTLEVEGGRAVLHVRDTGDGIASEHHEHLFDRFYRADHARSRATGGSGLGLAIAKAIVEACDGEIGFESELGKGSTFWVKLPISGGRRNFRKARGAA